MSNALKGCDNCREIADRLNNIIQSTGTAIAIDNQKIWKDFLHKKDVDNEYWDDTLTALEMLRQNAPGAFKTFNSTAINEARWALTAGKSSHPRCLDTKENKGKEWKLIMSIREVVNAIYGVDIPNK